MQKLGNEIKIGEIKGSAVMLDEIHKTNGKKPSYLSSGQNPGQ